MPSGISSQTIKNLVLDAGAVYINYGTASERLIGATSGGNTFTVEREIREIPVDGSMGKVKGLRRLIIENAMLTVNLKEMSKDNFLIALSGSSASNYPTGTPTHDSIRSNGKISDSDYLDNVAIVATVSGSSNPIIIIVENALSDGGFELGFTDKEESVLEVQFSAHYDPDDLDTVPYEIRYPKIA